MACHLPTMGWKFPSNLLEQIFLAWQTFAIYWQGQMADIVIPLIEQSLVN